MSIYREAHDSDELRYYCPINQVAYPRRVWRAGEGCCLLHPEQGLVDSQIDLDAVGAIVPAERDCSRSVRAARGRQAYTLEPGGAGSFLFVLVVIYLIIQLRF